MSDLDPEKSPPDRTLTFVACVGILSLALLVTFFVRYGSDLVSLMTTLHAWSTGAGPHP